MRHCEFPQQPAGHVPADQRLAAYGRLDSRGSAAAQPFAVAPVRDADAAADAPGVLLRDAGHAVALRAWSANGFGDAAAGAGRELPVVDAAAPDAAGRTVRGRNIGAHAVSALRGLVGSLRRRLNARATYRALSALDARALHDMGLDRSEIGSVAVEIAYAGTTRIHALATRRTTP